MRSAKLQIASGWVVFALGLAGISSGQTGKNADTATAKKPAQKPAQEKVQAENVKTFDTAQDAAAALIHAAQSNDTATLGAIFGSAGRRILSSGDAEQDQQERIQFAKLAAGMHELQADPMNPDRMILAVGSEDWPFPIPLVRRNDKWSFDASQGATEMRARRIGANELDTIEICAGYVEAQQEYAMADRGNKGVQHYAERLMSTPGQQDGLYWEVSGAKTLVPKRFAQAAMDPGSSKGAAGKATPYHGYYFRILKAQGPNAPGGAHTFIAKDVMIGGFGLIAWPAEYGVTGMRTFMVNQAGQIYEKNLGKATAVLARTVTKFDPDPSWMLVQ